MILNVKGLEVRFNPAFFLIMACALLIGSGKEIIIIFLAIFIHEWTHSAVGRAVGYKVKEIELTPYGGAAKFEGLIGAPPIDEIIISVSGPLINIIIAVVGAILDSKGIIRGDLFIFFIKVNLYLALFNLLPALPLDGGRIMRAILSIFIGYQKSTEIGMSCGKILAFILFLFGIYLIFTDSLNIMPIIVSLFIFWSLKNEEQYFIYAYINNISKKSAKLKQIGVIKYDSLIVSRETPLKNIIRYLSPNKYCTIKVINHEGKILGELTEEEILKGLLTKGMRAKVEDLLIK